MNPLPSHLPRKATPLLAYKHRKSSVKGIGHPELFLESCRDIWRHCYDNFVGGAEAKNVHLFWRAFGPPCLFTRVFSTTNNPHQRGISSGLRHLVPRPPASAHVLPSMFASFGGPSGRQWTKWPKNGQNATSLITSYLSKLEPLFDDQNVPYGLRNTYYAMPFSFLRIVLGSELKKKNNCS